MDELSKSYYSMFNPYNDYWKISATHAPTYWWDTDQNGNFRDVWKGENTITSTEIVGSGKGSKEETKVKNQVDIPAMDGYISYFSLFNDYRLFDYSGAMGFHIPATSEYTDLEKNKYLDNMAARAGITGMNDEPTYTKIIEVYSDIMAARYKIQDFIYNKHFKNYPPNYLITLRRYPHACTDMPFNLAMTESLHADLHSTEVMRPQATATTYFGGDGCGNKIEDLLKMTWGVNYEEKTAEIQTIQNMTPGLTAFGYGQRWDDKSGTHMKNAWEATWNQIFTGYNYATQTIAERLVNIDPWEKWANYTKGPVDVINKTKARTTGLNFEHSMNLKFDYTLKSFSWVNPKIAMLDIISNMIAMGTNSGNFWGGATRYYGNGGGYGQQLGPVEKFRKGDYAGYFGSLADNMKGKLSNYANPGGKMPSSFGDIIQLAKNILSGIWGNFLGSLINDKVGKLGVTPPAHALLTGAPTGYWHLTVGNPLNPILMMGNMIVKQIEMTQGGGLGYDDFPVDTSFSVQIEHGKPRDAGDIESMFNAGKGRIYLRPYVGKDNNKNPKYQSIMEMQRWDANKHDAGHFKGSDLNYKPDNPYAAETSTTPAATKAEPYSTKQTFGGKVAAKIDYINNILAD